MVTVTLLCQLELPGVDSLKGKRRILKSLIARLRNNFNISIAEVGDNDILRSALLGAAVVANNNSYAHQVIAQVVNKIEAEPNLNLAEYRTETF